jgi:hypothetical protein
MPLIINNKEVEVSNYIAMTDEHNSSIQVFERPDTKTVLIVFENPDRGESFLPQETLSLTRYGLAKLKLMVDNAVKGFQIEEEYIDKAMEIPVNCEGNCYEILTED